MRPSSFLSTCRLTKVIGLPGRPPTPIGVTALRGMASLKMTRPGVVVCHVAAAPLAGVSISSGYSSDLYWMRA